MVEQKEKDIPIRFSGQDLGNPNPPSLMEIPHEGHKSDTESWTRTKNKKYLKKRVRQLITGGSTDRGLFEIIRSRRQN